MSAEIRAFLTWAAGEFAGFAFRYSNEVQLQERIAEVLDELGVPFRREVELDAKNRVDFLLDNGVIIEVKIQDGLTAALRQCERYAQFSQVTGVLLAASHHLDPMLFRSGSTLADKPLQLIKLRRQAL